MDNLLEIDGCVFSEDEFKGFSAGFLNSSVNTFFLTLPSFEGFTETVKSIGRVFELSDHEEKNFKIARNYNDLVENAKSNKKSIVLTFQEPYPIGNSLNNLRVFYELGVRVIQLTYNKSNYIGVGCTEKNEEGLTDFGRELIAEMNRLGILIDLSHCNQKTAMDAIKASSQPVVFSHANSKEICDNPRNKTNKEIKLLAEKGGVIGLTPWAPTCWKGEDNKPPSLEDYLDHVDHVVKLVGIDHVGFGGDSTVDEAKNLKGKEEQAKFYPEVVGNYYKHVGIDPEYGHAQNFKGSKDIQNVVKGLNKRGYSEVDINKFLGGNFARVIKQVWN